MNKRVDIAWGGKWFAITLALVADEYEPHAVLTAKNDAGETVATYRVAANFKLSRDAMNAWVRGGFLEPSGSNS